MDDREFMAAMAHQDPSYKDGVLTTLYRVVNLIRDEQADCSPDFEGTLRRLNNLIDALEDQRDHLRRSSNSAA